MKEQRFSPWEVGHSHYNQRDLYTHDARVDDAGYARGPAYHPEVGSYAYRRTSGAAEDAPKERDPSLYEREAWPWLNYRFEEERPSDKEVLLEVEHALAMQHHLDASNVDVTVEDAVVTLRGTVPTREEKRVAGHVVESCRSVAGVHNRLRVHRGDDTDELGPVPIMPGRAFG